MTATIIQFPQEQLSRRYDDLVRDACSIHEATYFLLISAIELALDLISACTQQVRSCGFVYAPIATPESPPL